MQTTNKLLSALILTLVSLPALADATFHALRDGAFVQDWNDAALIGANDDWSGVASLIGYRGDGLVAFAGANPQGILADGGGTPVDVIANQANPDTLSSGGVAEFALADPVVALQGSGAADAPHLVLYLDARGMRKLRLAADVRDIDGSADDAVQPLAVQYRVGAAGDYTDLAAAFVADASSGPGLATRATAVDVLLPALADDMAQLFVRFITANAAGGDEWLGIDNIRVSAEPIAPAQSRAVTAPASLHLAATLLLAFASLSRRRRDG